VDEQRQQLIDEQKVAEIIDGEYLIIAAVTTSTTAATTGNTFTSVQTSINTICNDTAKMS